MFLQWPPDGPKHTSVYSSPSGEIEEGSSVTLSCSSEANPAANFTWFKEHEDSVGRSGQNYTIANITSKHGGNYYCRAHNGIGRHNSTLLSINVTGNCLTPLMYQRVRFKDLSTQSNPMDVAGSSPSPHTVLYIYAIRTAAALLSPIALLVFLIWMRYILSLPSFFDMDFSCWFFICLFSSPGVRRLPEKPLGWEEVQRPRRGWDTGSHLTNPWWN